MLYMWLFVIHHSYLNPHKKGDLAYEPTQNLGMR